MILPIFMLQMECDEVPINTEKALSQIISVLVWIFMVLYLDALPGSYPVFLFTIVNMPQCCGGMRGWVSFAGGLERLWFLIESWIKSWLEWPITGYPVKKKECTDSTLVLRMPTMGLCFQEKCLLFLNQPSLVPLTLRVWWNLGGP